MVSQGQGALVPAAWGGGGVALMAPQLPLKAQVTGAGLCFLGLEEPKLLYYGNCADNNYELNGYEGKKG